MVERKSLEREENQMKKEQLSRTAEGRTQDVTWRSEKEVDLVEPLRKKSKSW